MNVVEVVTKMLNVMNVTDQESINTGVKSNKNLTISLVIGISQKKN